MIRRLQALVWKEFREHAVLLGVASLALPFAWLFFALAAFGAPTTVSYLEIHANFMRFALIPFAFAVGNRLVVADLQGRSGRLLEALPMRRVEPLAVKWTLGALLLSIVAGGSMALGLLVASLREPIDLGLVASLVARTFGFTLSLWSFLFLMGQLGKLRVPLYLALGLALILLASTTELELMRFGPFALIGPDFAVVRDGVPWAPLLTSLAIGLGALVVVALLQLVREGGLEESLAKPMTSRERAMVGIAVCVILMVWSGLAPEPQPAPYRMSGDFILRSTRAPLVVGYGSADAREDAEALLARLEPSLLALMATMGWPALPEARVVLRTSLDGRTFELARLRPGDGALVRANFLAAASPDLEGLEAALVRGLLDDRTNHRAGFEPQAFVRAGFPLYFARCGPHRAAPDPGCELSAARRAMAVVALSGLGSAAALGAGLEAFGRFREQVGDRVSESAAASGMVALARATSGRGPSAFARALFSAWAANDSRVALEALLSPPRARLLASTGIAWESLLALWQAELAREASDPEVHAIVERVSPRASASLALEREGESQRTLAIDVRVPWSRTEGVVVTAWTAPLGPLDERVEEPDMRRDQVVLGPDEHERRIELAGRFSAGERVLVAIDVEDPTSGLEAPVRVLSSRRTLE